VRYDCAALQGMEPLRMLHSDGPIVHFCT